MANFTALKTAINNAIKTNGNEEITGAVLQAILDAMVETLGESAITNLENALAAEVTNRENAVGSVASDLTAEALARANKDNQLDNRINAEEANRANADAALSRTIDQGFQTLGSQMTALSQAISALNAAYQNGYLYGGIATPSSSPADNKCFYIGLQAGTYTNFGGVGVVAGINILRYENGWLVEHIYDQTTLLNEFYLLRQQVIQAITSFAPIVIEGDVTNAPDEEDLTSNAQHLLQFKNNAYSPLEFSGLGRKYLRKNIAPLSESAAFNGFVEGVTAEETLSGTPEYIFWDRMNTRFVGIKDGVYYADWSNSDNYVPASTSLVYMYQGTPYRWDGSDFSVDETEVPNLVNCLTQDMINEANTIYIIRYDYTLKEDITIPANCVLQFDGGSISGEHTITGVNTEIVGNTDVFILNKLRGAFNSVKIDIQEDFILNETINILVSNVEINLNNHTITGYRASSAIDIQLLMLKIDSVSNIKVYNGIIDGGLPQDLSSHTDAESNAIWVKDSENVSFENIQLNNSGGCYLVGSLAKNYCSFRIDNTNNIALRNFTIFKALTEGVVFWDSNNIVIEDFHEIRANGTFSWTALHLNACQYVIIKDCVFEKNDASGSCIILGAKHALVDNIISNSGRGIDLSSHPYTTFEEGDITIQNCNIRCYDFGIMRQWPNAVNGTLKGLNVINCSITLFSLSGNSRYFAFRLDDVEKVVIENNTIGCEGTPDYTTNPDYIPNAFTLTRGLKNIVIKNNNISVVKGIEIYEPSGSEATIEENIFIVDNTFKGLGMSYPPSVTDKDVLSQQCFIRALRPCNFKQFEIKGNKIDTVYYGIYLPAVFINSWNISIDGNIFGNENAEITKLPIKIDCLGDAGVNYVFVTNNKFIKPAYRIELSKINFLVFTNNFFDLSNEPDSSLLSTENINVSRIKKTLIVQGNINNKTRYSYAFLTTNNIDTDYKYINIGNTVTYQNNFSGDSAYRPSYHAICAGHVYFDKTLGKPIWWSGSAWVDATGATV